MIMIILINYDDYYYDYIYFNIGNYNCDNNYIFIYSSDNYLFILFGSYLLNYIY